MLLVSGRKNTMIIQLLFHLSEVDTVYLE